MDSTLDKAQISIRSQALLIIVSAILIGGASSGLIVGDNYWLMFAFFGATVIYWVILKNWRRGIYGLLVYLPFAGLPTVLLYPAPAITLLIKDLLFVIPAYLGFILAYTRNRHHTPFFFVGAPVGLFGLLAGILVIHLFNPNLVNPLVGLIGLKVWLFYVPLYFLGYHLIYSKDQLFQLARVILFISVIPITIGILQALSIYGGYADALSDFYEPIIASKTLLFRGYVIGTGKSLLRIPSIFTFVTQYWTFLLAMLPISYAMWIKAKLEKKKKSVYYFMLLGVIALAGLSSGARAAFVMIPCYLLLLAIVGGNYKEGLKLLMLVISAFFILVALLGTTFGDLFSFTRNIVGFYSSEEGGIVIEHSRVLDITRIGLGTGMSTGPARYAFSSPDETVDLVGLEGFYVKTIAEIGIPGLMIVVALFTQLLLNSYKAFASLQDRALRAFGAGILVFLFIQIIYSTKGAILDIDPINVYFWLFAGILMKLPKLQAPSHFSTLNKMAL